MPVHDHFDGSANCVECRGECQLEGDSLSLTHLVRCLLETEAFTKRLLSYSAASAIREAGVDLEKFRLRAAETQ